MKFIQIRLNNPFFDKVTKDQAAKFVDQLSAIGGTMGLLTGFSIISGVETLYFAFKIGFEFFKNFRKKVFQTKWKQNQVFRCSQKHINIYMYTYFQFHFAFSKM